MIEFELSSPSMCKEILSTYPDYRVFIREGFAYRGASEREDDKQPHKQYVWQEMQSRVLTFEERMQRFYDWSAAIDIKIDQEKKEIHFNGFSENDMY